MTRTSGVLAISEMLAVGACWANATPGCITTADKATIFKDLRIVTNISLDRVKDRPLNPETRVRSKPFKQLEKFLEVAVDVAAAANEKLTGTFAAADHHPFRRQSIRYPFHT